MKKSGDASRYLKLCRQVLTLGIVLLFALVTACKKSEPEPLADIQQLNGRWKSDDFPVSVTIDFSAADTTAKIVTVTANNYSIRSGEVFWRNVVPTGSNTFRLGQLTKSQSGYYAFIAGKATLASADRLDIVYSGATDDNGQLKLDGKRATFIKE
jgi:hypothetical protein